MRKFTKAFALILGLLAMAVLPSCGGNNGRNIEIAGVQGPNITLDQDKMIVNMVFENIELEGGLRYNIPRYPNSSLEIKRHATTGGTDMTITLSLTDVMNGDLLLLDPQRLPGGRALPGVRSGALPAVAFSVQKFRNMSFYVGPEVFGVFVPATLGIDNGIASFRYYIGDKRAGTISLVGNDPQGKNSGLLLMLDMSSSTKRQLKNYLRNL